MTFTIFLLLFFFSVLISTETCARRLVGYLLRCNHDYMFWKYFMTIDAAIVHINMACGIMIFARKLSVF